MEAVQIIYDPTKIGYSELLDILWKQIDPTDPGGQFVDRGSQYKTAIIYHNTENMSRISCNRLQIVLLIFLPYNYFYWLFLYQIKPFFRILYINSEKNIQILIWICKRLHIYKAIFCEIFCLSGGLQIRLNERNHNQPGLNNS